MLPLVLDYLPHIPVSQQLMELVERKGLGHPDSICDAIMEAISVALCQTYLNATGQVLHHNIDKSVLVAGQTTPALGGGTVQAPMRLIVGDRATVEWQGQRFPVGAIAEATAGWESVLLTVVNPSPSLTVVDSQRYRVPSQTLSARPSQLPLQSNPRREMSRLGDLSPSSALSTFYPNAIVTRDYGVTF